MLKEKIDVRKLNAIKKHLVKGDMKFIARKLNLSQATVYKTMSGELLNLKVIDIAIQTASQNRKLFDKIRLQKGKTGKK